MAPLVVLVMILSLWSRTAMSQSAVPAPTPVYIWAPTTSDPDLRSNFSSPNITAVTPVPIRSIPIDVDCPDPEGLSQYFCSVQPGLTCVTENPVPFYKHIIDNPSFRDGYFKAPDYGWYRFIVRAFVPTTYPGSTEIRSMFNFMVNCKAVGNGRCESASSYDPGHLLSYECVFTTYLQVGYTVSVENDADGISWYMRLAGGYISAPGGPQGGDAPPLPPPVVNPPNDILPAEGVTCTDPTGLSQYFCAFQPGKTRGYVNHIDFDTVIVSSSSWANGTFTVPYFGRYKFVVQAVTPMYRNSAFRFMVNNRQAQVCRTTTSIGYSNVGFVDSCTFTAWFHTNTRVTVDNDVEGVVQDITISGGLRRRNNYNSISEFWLN